MHFLKQVKPGQLIKQRLPEPAWILDIACEGSFEINGRPLSAGFWTITRSQPTQRLIKGTSQIEGYFFSIGIGGNTYSELEILALKKLGIFSTSMAFPVLKLASKSIDIHTHGNRHSKNRTYTGLLLSELCRNNASKSTVTFRELRTVFGIIEELKWNSLEFPPPSKLVNMSGIRKFRFQKACLALYGQSCQKIIQHLKMKRSFEAILYSCKSINQISSEFGYRHSPNFITAFHKHFGITPMETIKFPGL